MSYTNGLGNLQNLLGTGATTDTRRSDATTGAASPESTSVESAARGSDQTAFSSTSGLLGEAMSGQDTRMPKVLSLSAAIASGTYAVSASDVAGKMIDSMLS